MSKSVRKTGKTFGVFVNGVLVEGGFFSKVAAEEAVFCDAKSAEAGRFMARLRREAPDAGPNFLARLEREIAGGK